MRLPADKAALVAVDLGAQSCRVSLLRWKQGTPQIQVVHRFPNGPVSTLDGLRWDIGRIFEGVTESLRRCAELAPEGIRAMGVDGWAVDYVRLGANGNAIADPFCYRDERTRRAEEQVHKLLSPDHLYALTGIQLLSINTLYQLYADQQGGMNPAARWLNLPEFITYRLGGEPVAEYTNATHTQLVSLGKREWCEEIFRGAGLDMATAPKIVPTGTIIGSLRGDLAELPAFRGTRLVAPACHDTASAIAGIPTVADDWGFISSGTWSLVGCVLGAPCVSEEARKMNFTNLGGAGGTFCFLKNVNGMWLLRQCMDEWEAQGHFYSMTNLLEISGAMSAPPFLIDVDAPELMLPGNMLAKVNAQVQTAGEQPFSLESQDIPRLANTIFHSLAARYAEVLAAIADVTGKKIKRLFIVGGGSRNALLNRLTAERTGLEVIVGSSESTTIGNFAIQLAALEGDWTQSVGVTRLGVMRWAEELLSNSLNLSCDLAAN
jgi:rhamnulokinase